MPVFQHQRRIYPKLTVQKSCAANFGEIITQNQSYQTLFSLFLRFLLLSLRVCSSRKYCLYFEMAKLSKKRKKIFVFMKKKVWQIGSRLLLKTELLVSSLAKIVVYLDRNLQNFFEPDLQDLQNFQVHLRTNRTNIESRYFIIFIVVNYNFYWHFQS